MAHLKIEDTTETESIELAELIEHYKDAVIENNEINNASFSDWKGGAHIIDTYETVGLDKIVLSKEERAFIEKELTTWLLQRLESLGECEA